MDVREERVSEKEFYKSCVKVLYQARDEGENGIYGIVLRAREIIQVVPVECQDSYEA